MHTDIFYVGTTREKYLEASAKGKRVAVFIYHYPSHDGIRTEFEPPQPLSTDYKMNYYVGCDFHAWDKAFKQSPFFLINPINALIAKQSLTC